MYTRVTATNTETSELLFDWSNLSRVNVVIDSPGGIGTRGFGQAMFTAVPNKVTDKVFKDSYISITGDYDKPADDVELPPVWRLELNGSSTEYCLNCDRRDVLFIHNFGYRHPLDTIDAVNEILDKWILTRQFFLVTNSLFAIKELYIQAQIRRISIPLLHFYKGEWLTDDLINGIPANSLSDVSVSQYKREMNL